MTIYPICDEVSDFIADNADPQNLIDFHPSQRSQDRLEELIWRSNAGVLSADERQELEFTAELDRILRMAKLKVRSRFRQD